MIFPHVKYLPDVLDNLENFKENLFYFGGEPDKNHSRLTVGKQYNPYTVMYAENYSMERIRVYVCTGDDKSKLRVDIKNFGTVSDLRDRKINAILNK